MSGSVFKTMVIVNSTSKVSSLKKKKKKKTSEVSDG